MVDTTSIGTYTISYSITDASGNGPNTISRTVIVWDSASPTITSVGGDVIEHEVNTQFVDPGVNIVDNSLEGFTVTRYGTFLDNFPNELPTEIGNYIIFYKVADASGNESEILGRVVKVVDTEAPEINLIGSPYVIVERWNYPGEDGYTLSDNYYANDDITVTMESNVRDATQPGLFTVKYVAEDPSGNVSPTLTRLVRVTYDSSSSITETGNAQVNVYPNPTTGKVTVEIGLALGQDVVISVVNLLGKEIMTIEEGQLTKKKYEIDLSGEAQGMYILKMQTRDKKILKNIILNR